MPLAGFTYMQLYADPETLHYYKACTRIDADIGYSARYPRVIATPR